MTRTIWAVLALVLAGCGGADPETLPPCSPAPAAKALVTPRAMPDYAACCRLPDGSSWPKDC